MHPRVMEQEQGFTWTFQPRHQTVFEMYLANTILDFEQTVVHYHYHSVQTVPCLLRFDP